MSKKHTPGKLLHFGNGDIIQASSACEPVIVDVASVYLRADCTQEGNARRLVACWNACEGIPTEVLEELDVAHALRIGDEWKAQRDLFARWMFMRGNHTGDWACDKCHPNSDMLAPAFVCAFHQAEVIAKQQPTDLADAPKCNGYVTKEMIAKYWPRPTIQHLPADDTEGGAV